MYLHYQKLLDNYNNMINTLQYDSMRSSGKAKLNADTLHYLYSMRSVYEKKLIPAKKEVKKNG
jgi:hypothetical protein